MDRLLTDYYRVRGWEEEGTPLRHKNVPEGAVCYPIVFC